MNIIAHLLISLILYALFRNLYLISLQTLLSVDFIICAIASILPDLDHINMIGKALKTKRFGPEVRTWLHELPGYLLFSIIGVLVYFFISPEFGRAILIGFSTHYFLDAISRPTRPFHPVDDTIVFYYLAPRSDLKALVIYDAGITGMLLGVFFLITTYAINYEIFGYVIILLSLALLVCTIPKFEKYSSAHVSEEEYKEPERLGVAKLAKEILQAILNPFVKLFSRISPDAMSGLGLVFSIFVAVFLFIRNIPAATVFLLISLFLDTIDGEVARYRKEASPSGWIIDVATDRLSEIIISIALPMLFILLTILNTALSIRSKITGQHRIIPLRHIELIIFIIIIAFPELQALLSLP
ncbi:MAG: metal-dependent hydrolase [Candidatus Asgardarchaeia archaeon]